MSETYAATGGDLAPRAEQPGSGDNDRLVTAKEASSEVLGEAQDRAGDVVDTAKEQAHSLLDQTRSQLTEQATQQQRSLASNLRALGEELSRMSSAAEDPGYASDLVGRGGGAASSAADWLDDREPGDVLGELSDFARQKPLVFLAAAGAAGVLVGRLARGVKDAPPGSASTTTSSGGSASGGSASGYERPRPATVTPATPAPGTPAPGISAPGVAAPERPAALQQPSGFVDPGSPAGGFSESGVRDVDVP